MAGILAARPSWVTLDDMEGRSVAFACDTKFEVEFAQFVVPEIARLGAEVTQLKHDPHTGALDVQVSVVGLGPDADDAVLQLLSAFEQRFNHEVITNPTFVWEPESTVTLI